MATCKVTGVLKTAKDKPRVGVQLTFRLGTTFATDTDSYEAGQEARTVTGDAGEFEIDLPVPESGTVPYAIFIGASTTAIAANLSEDVSPIDLSVIINDGTSPVDIDSMATVADARIALAELNDLANVNVPTPTDGQVLTYDSSTSMWVAETPSGGGGGASDIADLTATGWADGESVEWDSSTNQFVPVSHARLTGATFSGPVLLPDGSSSAPGVAFGSSTNTGLWYGGGILNAGVGGSGVIQMTSSAVYLPRGANVVNYSGTGLTAYSMLIQGNTSSMYGLDLNLGDTNSLNNGTMTMGRYRGFTNGTPTTGFGLRHTTQLQTSTTTDVDAAEEHILWATATHATRTSRWLLKTVHNGGALTDTIAAGRTGVAGSTGLWLYDEDNGALEQVTVGAADSGGSGFKALRIPN